MNLPDQNRMARAPVPGTERAAPPQARPIRPANPDDRTQVTVYLRQRPTPAGSTSDSAAPAEPASTREEFIARFGADPQEMAQVLAFADDYDLEVVEHDLARRLVILAGTLGALGRAFGVELREYEFPEGTFRGHEGPATVPSELEGIIVNVRGLTMRRMFA